jgi:hypothetical protein
MEDMYIVDILLQTTEAQPQAKYNREEFVLSCLGFPNKRRKEKKREKKRRRRIVEVYIQSYVPDFGCSKAKL